MKKFIFKFNKVDHFWLQLTKDELHQRILKDSVKFYTIRYGLDEFSEQLF